MTTCRRAVREVFVRLYEKGLVYRGHYLINWCPRCLTALSNEEAEKEETDGHLWYLKYPLAHGATITVATTRPETMLGDTAVAVHPDDPRYRGLIGGVVLLPLTDRKIPVIADEAIDPEFGTGAVKMTPAHDPLDFELGRRHGLASIDILTPDAHISDQAPPAFRGLDRFEARTRVVAALRELGLLEKTEPHRHAVAHCYRCGTIVEPRLSDQWFVRMAPLAAPALAAYRDGRLQFIPERRGEEYAQWMEGIRDWCISRQLWWGHRIPVWYCDAPACMQVAASREDLAACPGCGGPVRQDEDVLDTWFSSWLVPFSSLGWPEKTADLARYYPGDALVTAPEILFFWVAADDHGRARIHGRGAVPHHLPARHRAGYPASQDVQVAGQRDRPAGGGASGTGRTRSATPWSPAWRWARTSFSIPPTWRRRSPPGRNFANKLWNLGRLVLGQLEGPSAGRWPAPMPNVVERRELGLADRWIIARCEATVQAATDAYERLRLNDAANAIYHFLWSDLADWYIEQIKPRLYGDQPGGDVARAVVAATFETALRLLHPIMPFITEALWKRFPGARTEGLDQRRALAAERRPGRG